MCVYVGVGAYVCVCVCVNRWAGPLHGLVLWFDVRFPAPPQGTPLVLSTSPYLPSVAAPGAPLMQLCAP
jgi:hypothetical protein